MRNHHVSDDLLFSYSSLFKAFWLKGQRAKNLEVDRKETDRGVNHDCLNYPKQRLAIQNPTRYQKHIWRFSLNKENIA